MKICPEQFVAGSILATTAPLVGVSAIAIRASSPGPVIYRAQRVGLHGQPFTMYKLRTMHVSREGPLITTSADHRVFMVGQWLRMLKVDELPQLVNVLKGEMRFFGPRPEDPDIVAHHYEDWMMETLSVPPGIVGPGSLGYFAEQDQIPATAELAQQHYVERLLPRKLARELLYVRRPTRAYRIDLLCRTFLRILGLGRFGARRQRKEDLESDELLRQLMRERPTPPAP